jgi:hypothetical protein
LRLLLTRPRPTALPNPKTPAPACLLACSCARRPYHTATTTSTSTSTSTSTIRIAPRLRINTNICLALPCPLPCTSHSVICAPPAGSRASNCRTSCAAADWISALEVLVRRDASQHPGWHTNFTLAVLDTSCRDPPPTLSSALVCSDPVSQLPLSTSSSLMGTTALSDLVAIRLPALSVIQSRVL